MNTTTGQISGRTIIELFEHVDIRPVVVRIVGGGQREEQVKPASDWNVPKLELVGALRVAYEAERGGASGADGRSLRLR